MVKTVVHLSVSTVIALGSIAIFCALILFAAHTVERQNSQKSPPKNTVSIRPFQAPTGSDMHLPMGAAKVAELKAAYGDVNQNALNEVKEGWGMRSSTCTTCQRQAQRVTYAQTPVYTQPRSYVGYQTVTRPVATQITQRPIINRIAQVSQNRQVQLSVQQQPVSYVNGKPYLLPTAQPTTDSYQIDPSTCKDGSCALKSQRIVSHSPF